jgi:methylenetetrahydrofolate dehydrogenase (NADP+) / methenyltetrahydrofolate cyclohydrolase
MILDGKKIAQDIKDELKSEISELKKQDIYPGLAVILVGEDPASKVYVASKKKACDELGIYSESYELDVQISQEEILGLVETLNRNEKISGVLVQLPLPKHLDEEMIIKAIDVKKDVDCFHPENFGKVMLGSKNIINYGTGKDELDILLYPCTPAGVIEILERSQIAIEGKDIVVIGKSNIVGKPLAVMLMNSGATVTICHSRTKDLPYHVKNADIIISAAGKAGLIEAEMVKPGVVVIDVGINRRSDGKLVGDVNFEEVSKVASAITPVPGGVGPMTIAMLMKNTVQAAKVLAKK